MDRLERCKLAIEKGYTYDPITGKIYGIRGKEIKNKSNKGYQQIRVKVDGKNYGIKSHQFAYYWVHKKLANIIDHINGDKLDNRIENLRSVTNQQNTFNTKAKGYYFNKTMRKYMAYIMLDYKQNNLGYYDTEEEARQAYLDAKKIYHKIS
jgi:hypothetical protein